MSKRGRTTPSRIRPMALVRENELALTTVSTDDVPSQQWFDLALRLHATCIKFDGMAVAAPQVGVNVRLVVLADGRALLNPMILEEHGPALKGTEGCLTFPNRWWDVPRKQRCVVAGFHPLTGDIIEVKAQDVDARMWVHEIDHLDGLLLNGRFDEITDRVNRGR